MQVDCHLLSCCADWPYKCVPEHIHAKCGSCIPTELCCAVVQTDVPERSSIAMQTDFTYMTSVPVQTDPTEESLMDLRKLNSNPTVLVSLVTWILFA